MNDEQRPQGNSRADLDRVARGARFIDRASVLLSQLWRDLRMSSRRLAKTPTFTLFAIASLALGQGVTAAVYTTLYPILWPSSGIRDADRMVYLAIRSARPGDPPSWTDVASRGDYDEIRTATNSFSSVLAWTRFYQPFIDGPAAEIFYGEAVTGNAFGTLGVPMQVGRAITPDDDQPGASAVVVLSDLFWRRTLSGDRSVVGRVVRIGGRPYAVVGVAAAGFGGLSLPTVSTFASGWVPIQALRLHAPSEPKSLSPSDFSAHGLSIAARLSEGVTATHASAELLALGSGLDAAHPWFIPSDVKGTTAATAMPRRWSAERIDRAIDEVGHPNVAFLILGLVGVVLLVASTNIANLTLARGSGRRREFTLRRSLGASRIRLLSEQVTESALIATGGSVLAFWVARSLLAAVDSYLPVGLRIEVDTRLAPGVATATALGMVLPLFVFGVWPALQLTRENIRNGVRDEGASRIRWRTRRALIAAQVAVSAAFLVVAGTCLRGVGLFSASDSGVDVGSIAMSQIDFRLQHVDEAHARPIIGRLLELAAKESSIDTAAIADGMPFGLPAKEAGVMRPDQTLSKDTPWMYVVSVTPAYLQTLGIPVLRGRGFDDRDIAGARPVTILSEAAAKRVFGTTNAVGRAVRLSEGGEPLDGAALSGALAVVGVARDTDVPVAGVRRGAVLYLPLTQHYSSHVVIVARARTDPTAVAGLLRSLTRRASPDLVPGMSGTGLVLLAGSPLGLKVVARVALSLGGFALVLAMAGLYGVLSHLVASRTREMGVRLALGATPWRLNRMILIDGAYPVVFGLAVGAFVGTVGCALLVKMADAPMALFDPVALVVLPVPLAIATFLACYLPARRAARMDPILALSDV